MKIQKLIVPSLLVLMLNGCNGDAAITGKVEDEGGTSLPTLTILPDADPKTFKMIDAKHGQDSRFLYEFPSGKKRPVATSSCSQESLIYGRVLTTRTFQPDVDKSIQESLHFNTGPNQNLCFLIKTGLEESCTPSWLRQRTHS